MKATDNPTDSPFLPGSEGYPLWRERKLATRITLAAGLLVPVQDPANLSEAEYSALIQRLRRSNMAVYQGADPQTIDKESVRALGQRLGLHRLDPNMLADDDGITSLTVVAGKSQRGYIPYSDKRLLWHTDGYYNPPERRIRAMVLHCAQDAEAGGENQLLDPEWVYLIMRDTNPDWVTALMAPDAMTIPANTEPGGEVRPAQAGPVFSVDPETGDLHMRYTARTRSIEWKDDPDVREALGLLTELLADAGSWLDYRLQPGEGLVCNNVLHNRTAFVDADDPVRQRLIYRARYYDRIAGTGWRDFMNETE